MSDISIRAAIKRFGDHVALKRLDLDIRSGEFFTLLGPSGCGKTTLLRMIAGFLRQDEGDLSIAGIIANDLPPWKRDTGMVFQNYAIFPHMNVFENVAYGLKHRKVPKAEIVRRVERALERVQLGQYVRRLPSELSGGQKQRVVLARALVVEPKVLLMDEPLSNLDAKLRIAMRRDIRLIQQSLGITTVYVTHDQEEALAVSDRIMVMEEGLIRQIGGPQAIYDDPEHLFVAGFIGACNELHGARRDGGIEIGGRVVPLGAPGLEEGAPVTLTVRPEQIDILEPGVEAGEGRIVLEGRLMLASFLGPVTRLELQLAENGGAPLEIDVARDRQRTALEPGAAVRFAFDVASVHLFDGRTGARLRW